MPRGKTNKEFVLNQEEKRFSLRKLSRKQIFLALGVVILLGALYYFRSLFVVAIVNGQPITRLSLIRDLEARQGKEALDSLITKTLILQEAKKQKIEISDEEINQAIKKLEESISGQGQNLDQLLAAQGMRRNDLGQQIRLQKIVEKILMKGIKVSDEEVKEYFEKNKSTFPENAKLEDAKEEIKKQLEQEKVNGQVQPWIQSLRDSAKINYFRQL